MKTIRSLRAMHATSRALHAEGTRIAFVPTMGALHAGHLSLVVRARRFADVVVVSVFVNPAQFGPREDFARYPRTPRRDAQLLHEAGADILFAPGVHEMYPSSSRATVSLPTLAAGLCGHFRRGHF